MLGDVMDALGIRSHLDVRGLLRKVTSSERTEEYHLENGKVSINYDRSYGTAQVVVSGSIPVEVISELEQIGANSRARVNLAKYGFAFS